MREINLFGGKTKPHEPFWKVVDAETSESGEAEIQFYGYISEYAWAQDDISPRLFRETLDSLEGQPVTVRIHSGGGDVFAASAIRAMLMSYPGQVTTRIDGLCASAATVVALAGQKVVMQDSAYFMVHDPWCLAIGNAAELKETAKMLGTIKAGIVETYQNKTGIDPETISKLMSQETWMTAEEAVGLNFVDEVVRGQAGAPSNMRSAVVANAIRDYRTAPAELRAMLEDENELVQQRAERGKALLERVEKILKGEKHD